MLWGRLSELLEDQIRALVSSFEVKNREMLFEVMETWPGKIDDLRQSATRLAIQLRDKFKSLNATSQELIQLVICTLEFSGVAS
jgi:hypothetical protein